MGSKTYCFARAAHSDKMILFTDLADSEERDVPLGLLIILLFVLSIPGKPLPSFREALVLECGEG